jgi:ribosome-associated protein
MIQVTPAISIDDRHVVMTFIRASGPGGQNVNKVSSAVQLRFDVSASPDLPEPVKARLLRQVGSRATAEGVLILDASEHRSQARNRQAALDRLVELIRRAAVPPRPRRKTPPTPASRRKRLEAKRLHGQAKQSRHRPSAEE